MKARYVFWVVAMVLSILVAGCSKQEPTPEAAVTPVGDASGPRGQLPGVNRLALGTLKLEGTEQAVTAEQAGEMLPLWKIIQGGSLQGQAETDAVLKQIEGQLSEAQQAAIKQMSLTFQDVGTWMQDQGIEIPTRPAGQEGGVFQNMSEEERQKFRQEMQNMSPEQRATRLAEMGIQRPEGGQRNGPGDGRGFGGRGGGGLLVDPVIELLTERATE